MKTEIFAQHKRGFRAICLGGLLLLILLLPSGLATRHWMPVTGWGTAIVDDYCLAALGKSQNVYQVVCTLDSILSVARSGSVNAGLFGVGGTVTPAEALAPVHDTVKTLSDFLSFSIILLMVEKQSMGMMSILCFKLALVPALLCLLAATLSPKPLPAIRKAGFFLCKCAIAIWLILPLTALASGFIDRFYITPKYNAQLGLVKSEMARVFGLPEENARYSIGEMAAKALSSLGDKSGMMAKAREIFAYIKSSAANPNDLASLAMLMFSQIAVIVFVVPAIVIMVLIGICGIFLRPANRCQSGNV